MVAVPQETGTQEFTTYHFAGGTLRTLMDLAGVERRITGRVTCKCCGRMMLPSQQAFETLYTCSPACFNRVRSTLVQDDVALQEAGLREAQSWD
ncbi:MAG: hypothetical protein IPK19_05725 [Chloroflexi bacterium]|nr:hypothetical protein [Chloroflexota bacterium]